MRAPRRLASTVLCAIALCAAAPVADAAQAIGVTDSPSTITLRSIPNGIVVEFRGLDGTPQIVRAEVGDADDQRARLRYLDARPAGTRSCVQLRPGLPLHVLGSRRACTVVLEGRLSTWLVQAFPKRVPDFGGDVDASDSDIYISLINEPASVVGAPSWAHKGAGQTVPSFALAPFPNPLAFDGFPKLLAYPRWSKFSPGGYAGYLKGKHFPLLFGSLTYSGIGVYGPGNRYGAPTTTYGRNVYIDTLDSDYGKGWHRIMGVLTQPPNGTFCYEFSPKGGSRGKTGVSTANRYRLTAIGPGLTPVVRVETKNPPFAFGGPTYNPKLDKWGYGFSDGQAQALRDQMAMIGPGYMTKPKGKGSTDCGATLRQLPTPF